MKKYAVSLFTIVFLFFARAVANAQSLGNAGTIEVTAVDQTGAVVPGAAAELRNPLSGYLRTERTDGAGKCTFTNVPPNQYHLEVKASGFSVFNRDVTVRTTVPIPVQAALSVAGASSQVTVEASGADILEQAPYAHNDVDQSQILKLPSTTPATGLSDVITFATGGVAADSNGFFHPLGDHAQTSYVVDGQPINDQQSKAFSTQLPANAFQSLELITGTPSAEYGDKTSLIVSAVTRSGLGRKPTGSLDTYYGYFGTLGEEATLGIGNAQFGNFLVMDSLRTGRFLDSPEFTPFHDKGNNATIFDRLDWNPNGRDVFHLNIFG
ncbi:MAG TPA: carboxypeptidase regulatory-like domain-containing protein, partial [Bryobacteraceae bacterium]|nr:carboxypeptidase regulatory-like domain-containing protein [Bryobacteraceae bacterium]